MKKRKLSIQSRRKTLLKKTHTKVLSRRKSFASMHMEETGF